MSKANRFETFAVEDESTQQQAVKAPVKQAEAKKKPVVKVVRAPVDEADQAGFEKVDNGQESRRGGRGGRGGERGDRPQGERRGGRGGRGGDRPQGERRERPEGERRERPQGEERRGGDRGGRGRGRPRTAVPDGENGPIVERAERGGQRGRYEGKPREENHPFDRQDGTGRGRRGDKKGGHGRGGWGDKVPRPEDSNATPIEGETTAEAKPERERRERKPREEVKAEPVVEEEEIGFTLDDYIKAKQAKSQGLIKKQEVRAHEAIADKKIELSNLTHDE